MKNIYLIGPDNPLKVSVGEQLAGDLGFKFVDLDTEFVSQIGGIREYVNQYGYEMYAFENSKLFYELLIKHGKKAVFSVSPAFLMYKSLKQLASDHLRSLKNGISVLLLPDQQTEDQVKNGMVAEKGLKYEVNYNDYKKFGDIQITSKKSAAETASAIQTQLKTWK
jgi:shikimate kinase